MLLVEEFKRCLPDRIVVYLNEQKRPHHRHASSVSDTLAHEPLVVDRVEQCWCWLKVHPLSLHSCSFREVVRHVSIQRRRHEIWKSVSAQIGITVIHPAGVLKYSDKVSRITLIQV
ncbi:hypothetical protein N1851_017282 [Merluccius polli]|uniref:Uncharacterized protein n=1 Tax=Merluccius polli TaxID=89951 RepID=A0AA47MQL5_MERPO|nr:hypothetical protein N1851_017282 [Merluccius polli]